MSNFTTIGLVGGAFVVGYFLGKRFSTESGQNENVESDSEDDSGNEAFEKATTKADKSAEEHKMLLVIREDLLKKGKQKGMEQGKVAAQCCHATLGAYLMAQKDAPQSLRAWRRQGQAKICVKIPDLGAMKALKERLRAAGIVTYTVTDAGRTQIPSGTKTVMAVGPAPRSKIDEFARELKLY